MDCHTSTLKRRSLVGLALLVLTTACSSNPAEPEPLGPEEPPPPPPTVIGPPGRALLVGVGEFKSAKVKPLRGPVNDVPMMRALLRDRFGFDPAKMTTLLNEQATRDRVIEELDRHIAALDEGELFVFYLSGHGSQSPDRGTDEEDRLDETFIMYDSRTPSGWDLSDDDLNYSLAKLGENRAVVILDTCHSGSGTRGILVRRAVEVEDPNDPDLLTRGEPNEGGRGILDVNAIAAEHVLLTAAAANQVAVETKIDGVQHGVFTTALVRALSNSDPEKPLFDFVRQDLQREVTRLRDDLNIKALANPQLEAPTETWDLPLFELERKQARLAWSSVVPAGADRARVVDGASAGARIGSVWGVYPADEVDFAPGAALARARCVGMTPDGNDALLEFPGDAPDLGDGGRAVLVAAAPAEPIALQLAGADVRAALEGGLRDALGTAGRLSAELEPGGWRVGPGADGDFAIVLADESPWASVDAATAVPDLVALTKHCAVVDAFASLEHAASGLALQFELARSLTPPGLSDRGAKIAPEVDFPRYDIPPAGAERSLETTLLLDLSVDRPCSLTLVFVDEKGASVAFFPHPNQRGDFLPDGELTRGWVRIPDGLAGSGAGFHLDISPPAGIQAIAALVVDDAAAAKDIRARLAANTAEPDALIAELRQLREELLTGSLAHVDWDAATVTYVVEDGE